MTNGQIAALIFFIFFIIIIIIVLIYIFVFNGDTNRPVRSSCTSTSQCANGLVCSDNLCLSPVGSNCSSLSDCVSSATACFNNVCTDQPLSGPGGTPPCEVGLTIENNRCVSLAGGSCTQNSDCANGLICNDNDICVMSIRGLDEPCSDEDPCSNGYVCINDRCKIACNSYRPCVESSECEGDSVCISHQCVYEGSSYSSSSSDSSSNSSSNSSSDSSSSNKSSSSSSKSSSSSSDSSSNHKGCKCNSCSSLSSSSSSKSKHHKGYKSSKYSSIPSTYEMEILKTPSFSVVSDDESSSINSSYETMDQMGYKSNSVYLKTNLLDKIRSVKYRNNTIKIKE